MLNIFKEFDKIELNIYKKFTLESFYYCLQCRSLQTTSSTPFLQCVPVYTVSTLLEDLIKTLEIEHESLANF